VGKANNRDLLLFNIKLLIAFEVFVNQMNRMSTVPLLSTTAMCTRSLQVRGNWILPAL